MTKLIVKKAGKAAWEHAQNCVGAIGRMEDNLHDLQMYIRAKCDVKGCEIDDEEAQKLIDACVTEHSNASDNAQDSAEWAMAIRDME